jgi:RNA-directed DNA polymerase
MGKPYFNLYEKICHPANIWWAFKGAARGKRFRPVVAAFEYDLERNLLALEHELKTQTWQPGGYTSFRLNEPKKRLVNAAPFRDRVVHHALMQVIEPLFERQFIFDSYANRVGKGTHAALDRCTHYLRRHAYVMHLDVRQFFPSVDHQILNAILARTIGDPGAFELASKIIASGNGVQAGEYEMIYFDGDNLLSANRPRGLPIGNLTSQHWANVYLNELDQYAKRVLKCRAYIRYVDDVLIFSDEKSQLNQWRAEIIAFCQSLRLTLHEESAQSRPAYCGVSFLGFQVFPTHRRLKPANGYAFQRRLKELQKRHVAGEMSDKDFNARLQSWIAHASHGDTFGLRKAILARYDLYGGE